MGLNNYWETWLRREIYKKPEEDKKVEIIMYVYDNYPEERRYIESVISEVINGGSEYQARRRLETNIIDKFNAWKKKENKIIEEMERQGKL